MYCHQTPPPDTAMPISLRLTSPSHPILFYTVNEPILMTNDCPRHSSHDTPRTLLHLRKHAYNSTQECIKWFSCDSLPDPLDQTIPSPPPRFIAPTKVLYVTHCATVTSVV